MTANQIGEVKEWYNGKYERRANGDWEKISNLPERGTPVLKAFGKTYSYKGIEFYTEHDKYNGWDARERYSHMIIMGQGKTEKEIIEITKKRLDGELFFGTEKIKINLEELKAKIEKYKKIIKAKGE